MRSLDGNGLRAGHYWPNLTVLTSFDSREDMVVIAAKTNFSWRTLNFEQIQAVLWLGARAMARVPGQSGAAMVPASDPVTTGIFAPLHDHQQPLSDQPPNQG